MTYIELLNSFWDSTRFNPCSSNEAMMYFYLLHQCNIRRWINPFEFKTRNLEFTLGLSRKSIAEIRNKLKQRGLIEFGKGLGSGSAIYLVCGVEITDEELAKKICVTSGNTMGNTMGNTTGNTKGNTKGNTTPDDTSYIEDKRKKTKDNSGDNPAPAQGELPFPDEEVGKGKKDKKTKAPPPPNPTLGEVLEYFRTHEMSAHLADVEQVARRFFDYFNAVDWIDAQGRRIIRWKNRANAWMLDELERQRQGTQTSEAARLNEARKQEELERLRQVPRQIDDARFRPPEGYTPLSWYNELKRRAAAGDAEAAQMLTQSR